MKTVKPRPGVAGNRSRLLDVVATFDTTGSMNDKIQGLVESMSEIVAALGYMQLGWRFAVVPFGDLTVPGDRIVAGLPWAGEIASAQEQLRTLPRFSGGSNLGESSAEAMLVALDRDFRPNAVKVVVLLTDEPALGPDRHGDSNPPESNGSQPTGMVKAKDGRRASTLETRFVDGGFVGERRQAARLA